jgi:hypothetical protein
LPRRDGEGRAEEQDPVINRSTRRAALTATAVAVPIALILALVLSRPHSTDKSANDSPTAVVSVSAVPSDPSTVEPCAQVQAALPLQLNGANPRIVHEVQAVAWGEPAVVLRCGVARPSALTAGSTAETTPINGIEWLVDAQAKQIVYTVIDRSVYVEVTLPAGADPNADVPVLSAAIAKALPSPVCYIATPISALPLCTRRP